MLAGENKRTTMLPKGFCVCTEMLVRVTEHHTAFLLFVVGRVVPSVFFAVLIKVDVASLVVGRCIQLGGVCTFPKLFACASGPQRSAFLSARHSREALNKQTC